MNRMVGTQRSPFQAASEVTSNPSLHICSSDGQYLVHAGTPWQPQGNPWSCSGLAPAPSHGSTSLSSRNSEEDGTTCLPGKQVAGFPVRRTVLLKAQLRQSQRPGTGFCYFRWRSKYSQLCLFPAHGSTRDLSANCWAWAPYLEVPPTLSQPRAQEELKPWLSLCSLPFEHAI